MAKSSVSVPSSMVEPVDHPNHHHQVGGPGGFSNKSGLTFNIIWKGTFYYVKGSQ